MGYPRVHVQSKFVGSNMQTQKNGLPKSTSLIQKYRPKHATTKCTSAQVATLFIKRILVIRLLNLWITFFFLMYTMFICI